MVGVAYGHKPSLSGSPAASMTSHSTRATRSISLGWGCGERFVAPFEGPAAGPVKGKRHSTMSPGDSAAAASCGKNLPSMYCTVHKHTKDDGELHSRTKRMAIRKVEI